MLFVDDFTPVSGGLYRTQPEHRAGESERAPDRDQVERCLPESKCAPIDGNATSATDRFRFATAATRIGLVRTRPAFLGVAGAAVGSSHVLRHCSHFGSFPCMRGLTSVGKPDVSALAPWGNRLSIAPR